MAKNIKEKKSVSKNSTYKKNALKGKKVSAAKAFPKTPAKKTVSKKGGGAKNAKLRYYLRYNRHAKQRAFHADLSRNKWVFGGNRTGKTECGAVEAVLWATGLHPHRKITGHTEGWVVSPSSRFGRDIAQRKILSYLVAQIQKNEATGGEGSSGDNRPVGSFSAVMLKGKSGTPERGVVDYILVRNKFGSDSKIGFKSCDQGREEFQGEGLDWVWFDEEPPEDIYEECLLRTLDKPGSCVWATMTPLKGKSWVYDRIYLNADMTAGGGGSFSEPIKSGNSVTPPAVISCMFMSWEDNPYLSPQEIKKMQRALSTEALESREHGRFAEGTGMVFTEFGAENIIEPFDIDSSWYKIVSIDPGFTNPCAAVWIAADGDDNIFVVSDYSVAEQTVEFHAGEIKKRNAVLGFENTALIDSAALARTLGSAETVVEQFERCGIRVDSKVNKEVFGGIMRLKTLFKDAAGTRKLFIFRNCVNLIKELRAYWWGKDEKPVKKNDHCIDALRYFVSSAYPVRGTGDFAKTYVRMPQVKQKTYLQTVKEKFIKEIRARELGGI